MSFQNLNAYLPKDLLDSDDDVAQDTLGMEAYIVKNILDDQDEVKTADNSSCGNNSSSENSSIFSVQPFTQNVQQVQVNPMVGWKCNSCENFNCKGRTTCNKCEKEKTEEDCDVTKQERKQMRVKKAPKVNQVIQQGDKFVGITRGDRVVEFEEYNHALDNRQKKRKAANKKRDVGNWTCQGCFNHNFAFRQNCNQCWMNQSQSMQILYGQTQQQQQQMPMNFQPCQMQQQMYQNNNGMYQQQAQQQFVPQQAQYFAPQQQFAQYQNY